MQYLANLQQSADTEHEQKPLSTFFSEFDHNEASYDLRQALDTMLSEAVRQSSAS